MKTFVLIFIFILGLGQMTSIQAAEAAKTSAVNEALDADQFCKYTIMSLVEYVSEKGNTKLKPFSLNRYKAECMSEGEEGFAANILLKAKDIKSSKRNLKNQVAQDHIAQNSNF